MSFWKRTGAIFAALFLTLSLMAPQTALADATTDKSISDAASWIARDYANSKVFYGQADAIIALSAANREPDTVRAMLMDLKASAPAYVKDNPGGLAKIIMTADIAGQNPRTFLEGRDMVAELQAMLETDSGKEKAVLYFNPAIISIALSRIGEEVPQWLIDALLETQQGGGFGYTSRGTFTPDPDYTAVGLSAMNLISQNRKVSDDGRASANASIDAAEDWSADAKNRKNDGANYYWATYSPANSTGMLASALEEIGVETASPVRFLVSQQLTDGGWASSLNGTRSNVMATTQAILGVIGKGYGTVRSTQVPELSVPSTAPITPEFVAQPAPVSATTGSRVTFTVAVVDSPDLVITWQKKVDDIWIMIEGATGNTLTLDSVENGLDGLQVRAVATIGTESVFSDVASLTVTPVTPTTPNTPTETTTPATPTETTTPATPTETTTPATPTETTTPATPVKPGTPDLPNNPGRPNQPVMPAQPGKPGNAIGSSTTPKLPNTGV